MRTQQTVEFSSSPAVGAVQPSQTSGAFASPLLNRRAARSRRRAPAKKFNLYVKVDAAAILPDSLKQWADYANYLQHRIVVGRMYWKLKGTGFVSLHRRTLERAIHPSILGQVLSWMVENGVIERDGSRADGIGFKPARRKDGSDGISIGYRFGKVYERLPTQRVACHSLKANNKFLNLQNTPERIRRYTTVHRHLRAWLRRVSLDLPAALKLVRAANLDPSTAEQVTALSTYIANGDATDLTVCNYGRVHTAITRLLAPIRQCLSIGGQPLHELDIANSQPLFLAIYILETVQNRRIRTLPSILTNARHTHSMPAYTEREGRPGDPKPTSHYLYDLRKSPGDGKYDTGAACRIIKCDQKRRQSFRARCRSAWSVNGVAVVRAVDASKSHKIGPVQPKRKRGKR
jgi:hypothetical protein